MIKYEDYKPLFFFFWKLKTNLRKHWNGIIKWEIVEHVHNQVFATSKSTNQITRFVALTCDKVTALNNQSWISIHDYCVQDWCKIHVMLPIAHILEGSNTQILTKVEMNFVFSVGVLIEFEMPFRLLCFCVNGVIPFKVLEVGLQFNFEICMLFFLQGSTIWHTIPTQQSNFFQFAYGGTPQRFAPIHLHIFLPISKMSLKVN